MPTISVIVPVYKVEPYIHQCIDSILAQTYTDFELILVDDGSPDNCGMICDEYAKQDDRIRVIHQKNQGLSAARNAGIDIAKGEYLTFIDSDDLVKENYLERLYQLLIEYHAEISVCDMYSFQDGEEISGKTDSDEEKIRLMAGRDACLSIYRMDGRVPVMAWGKLYSAKLFADIRYPVGMIHEDDATTPKLLYRAKRIIISSDKLYNYRARPDGIMGRAFAAKRFDRVKAVQSCVDFFNSENDAELVNWAENAKRVMQAKAVIRAYGDQCQGQIPEQYRMSKYSALRNIQKNCNDDMFNWYLSLVSPELVRPYSYLVKIKKILGIRRK